MEKDMPRNQVPQEPRPIRVLAAVLEKNGLWLIAKRKRGDRFAGLWEFPGGKLEAGETPKEGLARELSEELGIGVRVGSCLGSVRYTSPGFAIELIAYRVSHLSGSFRPQDHDELRWVAPSEIGRFALTEPDRLLLQKLRPKKEPKAK
jgi:8-oxo-dGTP diphosphatase